MRRVVIEWAVRRIRNGAIENLKLAGGRACSAKSETTFIFSVERKLSELRACSVELFLIVPALIQVRGIEGTWHLNEEKATRN